MKKTSQFVLFTCILAFASAQAQTIVNSLPDLVQYLDDDNANIKVAPGTYTITGNDISNGTYGSLVPGELASPQNAVFLFEGNNSTYDFTGVTINFKTEVLSSFGSNDAREIQIIGNNNVLLNLTMFDDGSVDDAPGRRATNIVIDGASNRVEGFHVSIKGSYPYGYGDIFGKGGGSTIGHKKHSACLVRGNSNHLKGCTFIHKSYGHGIFMQAANDAIIEGCHVEGELRTVAEVLAEEGTGSPADNVNFQTVWGYDLRNLTNNYRFSLQEDGIRAYNGGTTIINGVEIVRTVTSAKVIDNTIVNMRSGVTLGLGKGTMYVENCTALGCESGFWGNNNATFVNCKGDASVGPLYSEDAARSGVTAELTLLDNHVTKIGNTPSLYIAGSNHSFTLNDETTSFINEIEILISGKRYAHRWLEGSGEEPPNRDASNITFNNTSEYPIILGNNASNNKVNSCGTVTNNGSGNTIDVISCDGSVNLNFDDGTFTYTVLNINPNTCEVTGWVTLPASPVHVEIPATVTDTDVLMTYDVVAIGEGAFSCNTASNKGNGFTANTNIQTVTLPSSVTVFNGAHCFRENPNITAINLDFITDLGSNAFVNCDGITGIIDLPVCTDMGAYAFFDCDNITGVNIPVAEIFESGGLYNMDGVKEFIVPASVTNVGTLFLGDTAAANILEQVQLNWDATQLAAVNFANDTKFFRNEWLPNGNEGDDFVDSTVKIYVPVGSKAAYEAHPSWGKFPSENIIEGAMPSLSTESFENLIGIKMYPNPANDFLTISNALDTTVDIYNIQGVLELKLKISGNEKVISLENLSSGIHFLKFTSNQGTVVKKLIKK